MTFLCSPRHPHLHPKSHPQPSSEVSLREERCSCHCALLTPCSCSSTWRFKWNQQFTQKFPPTHGSSLATGLIKLSIKKGDLCLPLEIMKSMGGKITSFDHSDGMFLSWSIRQAVWGEWWRWVGLATKLEPVSKTKGKMREMRRGEGESKEGKKKMSCCSN